LRLQHRAAEVAPAHAEFDRNIALLLLAVDEGGARHQVDACHLGERYLRDLVCSGILHRDRQTADRLDGLPVFRREPNDQREMPVAPFLVEIARRLPAHRGLHRRIDVAGREPIARGCLAINIDPQRRLAERRDVRSTNEDIKIFPGRKRTAMSRRASAAIAAFVKSRRYESRQRRVNRAETITMARSGTSYG
jgi:hypothetical protein